MRARPHSPIHGIHRRFLLMPDRFSRLPIRYCREGPGKKRRREKREEEEEEERREKKEKKMK